MYLDKTTEHAASTRLYTDTMEAIQRKETSPRWGAAIAKSVAIFLLAFVAIAGIQWPLMAAADFGSQVAVLVQSAMTALCVGGWFSLLLVFEPLIGEPVH